MRNKSLTIVITLVMVLSTFVVIPSDLKIKNVAGDATPPLLSLDTDYILEITEYLSETIFDAYGGDDFQKGRAFGTAGEHYARDYLFDEMDDLDLNPIIDNITDIDSRYNKHFPWKLNQLLALTDKLDIDSMSLTINQNGQQPENIDETEFFMLPYWEKGPIQFFFDQNFDFDDLTFDSLNKLGDLSNLKIHKGIYQGWIEKSIIYNMDFILEEILNGNVDSTDDFLDLLYSTFEDYYDFTFEDFDIENTSTYPSFLDENYVPYDEPYLLIMEDPWNNYDPEVGFIIKRFIKNRPHGYIDFGWKYGYFLFQQRLHILFHGDNFVGNLLYDFDENAEVHNMPYVKLPRPIIFINGELGKPIFEDIEDYTIDLEWSQTFYDDDDDDVVDSSNVIGEIEVDGADETVLIQCLYDSWWDQGTADSAIGMGIVLALAKYMKELEVNYGILPKYNVKFIAFAGEEYGLRGAYHYEAKYRDSETITHIIDMNQLGFEERDLAGRSDDTLKFNLHVRDNRSSSAGTKSYTKKLIKEVNYVAEYSNYYERTGEDDVFEVVYDKTIPSDHTPFRDGRQNIKTICFLKDTGWSLHHRTGQSHTKGDVIGYYDEDEVAVIAEMALNITKYFAYNSNCWIDGDVDYNPVDRDSNGDIDTIQATFDIDTNIPEDPVTVRATLYNDNFFNSKCMDKRFNYVIPHGGKEVTIQMTVPPTGDEGDYKIKIELLNATERVKDKPTIGKKITLGNSNYSTYSDFFSLYPRGNTIPNKPSLTGPTKLILGEENDFTACATDDNNDDVTFKFYWDFIVGPNIWYFNDVYNSGEECVKGHTYYFPTKKQIRVKARESYSNLSDWSKLSWSKWGKWSSYSDFLTYNWRDFEGGAGIATKFNSESSSSSLIAVKGMEMTYYSNYFGNPQNFVSDWSFESTGGGSAETYEGDTAEHTYSELGIYDVTLNVTDNDGNVMKVTRAIEVVNLSACYNRSWNYSIEADETIFLNDSSIGVNNLTNWSWDFGDGTNITYGPSVNHSWVFYDCYNVTLNVSDNESNTSVYFYNVEVNYDIFPPEIHDTGYCISFDDEVLNCTITANISDFGRGVDTVKINITSPLGKNGNYTMSYYLDDLYYYHFTDIDVSGEYNYSIWVVDNDNNTNNITCNYFYIEPFFGYVNEGNQTQNVSDRITGSNFTISENAAAISISAYIQKSIGGGSCNARALIYKASDSTLVGVTENIDPTTGVNASWLTFNFTEPVYLKQDTEYILALGSNNSCNLSYLNSSESRGFYDDFEMDTMEGPNPANFSTENRLYSIYCNYDFLPEIEDVINTPDIVGFGYNITFTANVTEEKKGLDAVRVNITYPDDTTHLYSMDNTTNDTYECVFTDTWLVGEYNYSIIAKNIDGTSNSSNVYSFNVSASANISVCTIKNTYGANESINITDPPVFPVSIGYELLDEDSVLHIWNKFDSYYFNTSSGIQLTNHYDEYWSHNVLMLGYYNNDQWNLIYRTDELSGFNKNIDTDNETYINVTLWKNLSYNGYDFRLAIRYHLGVGDNELTVIPYIKNLGDAIPYTLGFAWEINDIQVDMTPEDDYIEINGTSFYLNETVNVNFMNMTTPVYCWNETTNESYVCGYEAIPYFYIREDKSGNQSESLYLKWDESLDYVVRVKSMDGEYNAPVTLAFKIGTLGVDQEKYTELYWYDADQITYYFDGYDTGEAWPNKPGSMVDGNENRYASTTSDLVELCNNNTCNGTYLGEISKVELRAKGYYSGMAVDMILRPVYNGTEDGDDYEFDAPSGSGQWSSWFDITSGAETQWSWDDIRSLDCDVEVDFGLGMFTLYCSKVEVRVTYTSNYAPTISNPYPTIGSNGISISPLLNITVSDVEGDTMNITWYSNSSGSWQVFGTNSSVGNGTYHQTFSNASVNGGWWYWNVSVNDGKNITDSNVFYFYTGYESKIVNSGGTNLSGYLLIQVQYYNETSENWVVDNDTINETTPRTINASDTLALDLIFNGLVNTSDLTNGDGTYRVYAAFRDPNGDVLICNDESLLETWYEFEVDTS
jgi:hypothetical protein